MASNDILKKLSEQEMDRKDFLKYSGVALLGLVGLKTIVSVFTQADKPVASTTKPQTQNNRFNNGKYGA